MRKLTIQVESIDAGAERFIMAWEKGEKQGEYLTFETLDQMLKKLTSRRWSLLIMLQKQGPMSLRAVARALKRDVKNVHADAQALKELSLVEECDQGLYVPYDEIEAHMRLAA